MQTSPLSTFASLVSGPCPPVGDLLLSVAGVLASEHVGRRTADRLDEDARRLFGVSRLAPEATARRLADVLAVELGYRVRRDGPASLLLPAVVQRREGHPVVLAAIGCELLRRAGASSSVVHASTGWHVGLGTDGDAVLVAMEGSPAASAPTKARRWCGHEVARFTLEALERAFADAGEDAPSRRAGGLRALLPAGG